MRMNIRLAVWMIALVLAPGLLFAGGKISFRLQGGWNYISGGDVNRGTQAWFDYGVANWPVQQGGYRAVHKGYEVGGDIIFELTPRFGIGIGGGYMRISRASQMSLLHDEPSLPSGGVVAEPILSAVPIRAGVFLTLPLSRKINFVADGGLSYYFRARYRDQMASVISMGDILTTYKCITTRAEDKTLPVGFQAGIGFEYELVRKVFLCLNARGRYARLGGWKGSSKLEIWEYNDEDVTTISEEGTLYYESVPELTRTPRLIMVQSSPPDGPGGKPRQAAIDFSGVSLQFGIRIRLF